MDSDGMENGKIVIKDIGVMPFIVGTINGIPENLYFCMVANITSFSKE